MSEGEADEGGKIGGIMFITKDKGEWKAMQITVDSGAVGTVGPKTLGKAIPILETEASKSGKFSRAANDTKIATHGKKAVNKAH